LHWSHGLVARRRASEPEWTPPPVEQLQVLRRQIAAAVERGEQLKAQTYAETDGAWGAWDSNLGDLVEKACGPRSAQATSYHYSTGIFGGGPDRQRYYSESEYESALVAWRNESISKKSAAARGALEAIDLDLERRGATPAAMTLAARDFSFITSVPLRAIVERDYDELKRSAGTTVKAASLLAGSVIEGVLIDALGQKGFAPKQLDGMRFVDLINEAAAAKVIGDRTQKAAHAVRDTRNFVHPAVELREGRLRKVDADAAIALMQMVLEDAS